MTDRLKNIRKLRHWQSYLIFALLLFVYPGWNIQAQDIHFSQFYATPVITNPASTGMSGENLRIANNYRNQWAKIGVPYRTFYSSIDKKVRISGNSFGIGGAIVHDQSSVYNLTADEFLVSFSYSRFINNHQVTVGVQPGFAFKSFSPGDLTFGSQFDQLSQIFNPGIPSSEQGLTGNLHYFDLNVGIFWRTLYHNLMPSAGFSISHVLKPEVTFSTTGKQSHMPMKVTFNGQVRIPINDKFDVMPCVLYSSTPGASELLLGGVEGYAINEFIIPVKKVYAVNLLRVNPFSNFDALILGGGAKFPNFDLGITYDISVSPLSKASYFTGAFEISLVFTGSGRPGTKVNEPCYIY